MSEAQWRKILKDLQGDSEKLIILALMHVPRLRRDESVDSELQAGLAEAIHHLMESSHPDISFLARKASNHVGRLPIKMNSEARTSKEESQPVAIQDEDAILSWLRDIPSSYQDYTAIEPHLASPSERIVSASIEAYARCAPVKFQVDLLKPFLDHVNNRIRGNAIVAIGCLKPELVHEHLKAMLNTTRISMRESAVWALSQLPSQPEHQNLLLRCLHDPYRDIRVRAIQALVAYPDETTRSRLKQLSMDQDIEICEAAETVLASFGDIEKKSEESPDDDFEIFHLGEHTSSHASESDEDLDEFIDEENALSLSYENSLELEPDFLESPAQEETPADSTPAEESGELFFDVLGDSAEEGIPDLFANDPEAGTSEAVEEDLPEQNLFADMPGIPEMEELPSMEELPEMEDASEWASLEEEPLPTPSDEIVPPPEPENLLEARRREQAFQALHEYLLEISQNHLGLKLELSCELKWSEVEEEHLFSDWFENSPHEILWNFLPEQKPEPAPEPVAAPIPKSLQPEPEIQKSLAVQAEEPAPAKPTGPDPKKLLQIQEDLEDKIQETLQEAGTIVLQISATEPMTNAKIQKITRETEELRNRFRQFLDSSPSRTRENLILQRKLQIQVRKSLLSLGKLTLMEMRAGRFRHKELDVLQARLKNYVPKLEKVRSHLRNLPAQNS